MKKLFLLGVFVLLAGCSDVITDHYQTYDDAKNDHLFIRGWLPDILPVATFDIHVANELDSNISTGSFTIPINELARFISHLQKRPDQALADEKYSHQQDDQEWVFTINRQTGVVKYKLFSLQG